MAPAAHPRTQSRRQALDVLFAADVAGLPAADAVRSSPPLNRDAAAIVRGVAEHLDEIDALIRRLADRWTLERMPVVDRNLLRIGVYEIRHRPDVPAGAAINDAVALAKLLSTDDSGRFVNGILGRVARDHGR